MRTVYKKLPLALLALVILSLASCQRFLDIKPYGKTIPKTAEEFASLLQSHLNAIDVGTDAYLVGNTSQILQLDAGMGDDLETCLSQSGNQLPVSLAEVIRAGYPSSVYKKLYEIIRDCNIVLANLTDRESEEARRVLAVAYGLRGASYYQLLRLFCEAPVAGSYESQLGVPLVREFSIEDKLPRSTMAELITLIESDLTQSASYGDTHEDDLFTTDVVRGYLARLYFWTEQWDKALAIAQELVAKYPLLSAEEYKKMMTEEATLAGNQLIKSYRSTSAGSGTNMSAASTSLQYRPVSKRLIDAYGDETERDVRYAMSIDKKRIVIKPFFCGLRAAELKLIEAECLYHLGSTEQALQSINELRAHRIADAEPLTLSTLPEPLASELITEDATGKAVTPLLSLIQRERRKELFLEGDRFYELKRNGSPEYWEAYNGRKYVTSKYMYTLPIPYREVNIVGESLVQNPGYVEVISD